MSNRDGNMFMLLSSRDTIIFCKKHPSCLMYQTVLQKALIHNRLQIG